MSNEEERGEGGRGTKYFNETLFHCFLRQLDDRWQSQQVAETRLQMLIFNSDEFSSEGFTY